MKSSAASFVCVCTLNITRGPRRSYVQRDVAELQVIFDSKARRKAGNFVYVFGLVRRDEPVYSHSPFGIVVVGDGGSCPRGS